MNMVQEFAIDVVLLSLLCGAFIYGLSQLMYDENDDVE